MSLSKLELIGFKSFMSPVTLNFREGITAILGPNGCGKTNIVDAVRWVLGEQSARQLRGAKMENVIFNGTQMHKPLGCAVVNLTVDNSRGVFPVDYSEIMITRKVYRSGISEYFINKSPCRLRDIKELFADTGTGSHSYAVIEQEMIEYVLNDAHGERRHMFEEASGIVKYRMRREEAQRKLSLTETDLVRLDDILEELGKQVRSLKYQVGKAKRYERVREKVRAGELILLRKSLSGLLAEKRDVDSKLSSILDVSKREDDSVGQMERDVEARKLDLHDLEKRSTELQNKRYEIRKEIQAAEEKVIQFTERRSEAEKRIERAELEITEAENRLEKIGGRISAVNAECEELAIGIAGEEEVLERLDGEFKDVSGRIQFARSKLVELKQTQLDFLHDQARVKSSMDHYENLLSELDTRAALMREEILRMEQATRESAAARDESEKELANVQDLLVSLSAERDHSLDSSRIIEERLSGLERELSEKRTELARVKSKHDLLRRMSENFEGFTSGARFVLQKGDSRVKGPLAEFLDVDERFRPALEAVLGGMFDGVVIDSVRGAVDIMKELSQQDLGKVHFFVESGWDEPDVDEGASISGSLGMLSSHVKVKEPLKGMIVGLLGRVIVFEDDEQAIRFLGSSESESACDAVTLSGTYFCRGKGIYYAGRSSDEASLLGRAERMDEMESSISELEKKVSELSGRCDTDRGERERLLEGVRSIEEKLRSATEEARQKSEALKELERDHILKKEKGTVMLKALDELEASRSETLARLEEKRLAFEMQQEFGDGAEAAGLEREVADLQRHKDSLEEELSEKRVDITSRKGSLERKREEIRGLGEMEKQFKDIVSAREQERSSSRDEIAELTVRIDVERAKVKELLESENEYQSDLDETNAVLEEKRSIVADMEKELKQRQTEREEFMARQNELKVKLSSIDTRMKDLVDRAREINKEDLGCYLEGEEIPFTEEEMEYSLEALDKEKSRLESIGPVNLAAVEEHEEKKNRLEFLLAQKEDLTKAKEELNEAIRKINKRARKQFAETFDIVRRYFSEIFQVLFEGGEADLSLSGDGDPLEADVVITARPKGKRLQDISLLSGGERALTALSLLFALYKAKPSPFCIFDEVDAPLDDANIMRFVKMLKKFQEDTQFVIITHNKRTMEVADSLFGITMEEKGISRVVSVDIRDVEHVLANKRAASQDLAEVPVSSN